MIQKIYLEVHNCNLPSPPTGKPKLLIASVSSCFVRCNELFCDPLPADNGRVEDVSILRVNEP